MKRLPILSNPYEDITLWLHVIARKAEEARMRAWLPPAPEAEAIDEDGDGGLPPLAALDDEYSTAADLGREE